MLEIFRNAAKGWAAKILLGLLAVAFGVWGITDVFRGGGVQDLATVGGQTISGEAYSRAIARVQQQMQQQSGAAVSLEDMRKQGVDVRVRDNLISAAAIDDQAKRLNIAYSVSAIAQDAAKNPAFQDSSGKFNADSFRRTLEANGLSEATYFQGEMETRIRTALAGNARVAMVPQAYSAAVNQYMNETRTIRYFTFQVTDQAAPQPSDAELKQQYESTPGAYTAPEYRSVAILKADPADGAGKYEVSPDELKAGFEKYKGEFVVPEKRSYVQVSFSSVDEAKKAKARIDGGEDILKIATELKFKPGDVTFTDRVRGDLLDEKIADAVFKTELNKVSDPIQGALATALIKVTGIVAGSEPTLDGIKPQITQRVQMAKAAEDIQNVYDSVEEMRSNDAKFEEIAAKLNIPITMVPAVSASGLGKDGKPLTLPGGDELVKAVFGGDVGVQLDALNVEQGYVWFDVREVIPSALKPFDAVKDQVKADWFSQHQRQSVEAKAKQLVERGRKGETLDALAKEMSGTIKTAADIRRNQTTPDVDGVAGLAIYSVAEKDFTWSLEADGKSARLMQVDKVTVPAFDAKAEIVKKLQDDLKASMSNDLSASYLSATKSYAKVSLNDAYWQQISGAASAN